jgi:hypothetical protein
MSDSVADRRGSVELLEWHAGQLRLIADRLGDPCDTLLDAGEAAACVHAITTGSVRALRALAAWQASHAAELFEHGGDAEQDATALARASAKELRAFAGELEAAALRHAGLIEDLRRLTHRAVYEVTAEEVEGEEEYYAVVEVERASASHELIHRRYTRVDVARSYAQHLAEHGSYKNVYRVVPVLEGERLPHVAQWPGGGYYDD